METDSRIESLAPAVAKEAVLLAADDSAPTFDRAQTRESAGDRLDAARTADQFARQDAYDRWETGRRRIWRPVHITHWCVRHGFDRLAQLPGWVGYVAVIVVGLLAKLIGPSVPRGGLVDVAFTGFGSLIGLALIVSLIGWVLRTVSTLLEDRWIRLAQQAGVELVPEERWVLRHGADYFTKLEPPAGRPHVVTERLEP